MMESTLSPSSLARRNSGNAPKSFIPPPRSVNGTPTTTTPSARSARPANGTSRTNLFIRYLPKEVDDKELLRLFEPYGTIATSMVMRDIHTGESLGTAFVRYEASHDAEMAKHAMEQFPIYNKKLSIQWARREHDFKTANNDFNKKQMYKLFLRNIPLNTTMDDLAYLLSAYGTVVTVSIHADTQCFETISDHHRSVTPTSSVEADNKPSTPEAFFVRRIAFVTFAEEGSAERALKGVHNTCPFPDCEGIPFMGKLINDHLLSKKQQQFQQCFVNGAAQPTPTSVLTLTPRAMSSASLPSPVSSQSRLLTPYGRQSTARSPTTSQCNISIADFNSCDAALYPTTPQSYNQPATPQQQASNFNYLSYGTSMTTDAYLAQADRVTPASEASSVTPCANLSATPEDGNMGAVECYNSRQRTLTTLEKCMPQPLSQDCLQGAIIGSEPLLKLSPSGTPSRGRRYTHNPYAALVIQ